MSKDFFITTPQNHDFITTPQNYEKGRYERLKESIDEYLGSQGSDTGSKPFLRDLNKACSELNVYHQECVDNFAAVQSHFSLAEESGLAAGPAKSIYTGNILPANL